MKTNPFSYLKKAPRFKGHRRLKPDEIGQAGDLFGFLSIIRRCRRTDITTCTCPLDLSGGMRIGRSLRDSREAFFGQGFDGILYRPIK